MVDVGVEGLVEGLGAGVAVEPLDCRRVDEDRLLGDRVVRFERAAGSLAERESGKQRQGRSHARGHGHHVAIGVAVLQELPFPLDITCLKLILGGGHGRQGQRERQEQDRSKPDDADHRVLAEGGGVATTHTTSGSGAPRLAFGRMAGRNLPFGA